MLVQRTREHWKTYRSVFLATDDTESANTVAEKLEDLTVKDKASEEKEEKKETEEKQDEKEVKTEEKNWEPSCLLIFSLWKFPLFLQ